MFKSLSNKYNTVIQLARLHFVPLVPSLCTDWGEIDSRKHRRKHKMNTSQQLPTIADFALCLTKPASYTNIHVFFLLLLLKRNLCRPTRSNGRNIAAELLNCGSSFLRPY